MGEGRRLVSQGAQKHRLLSRCRLQEMASETDSKICDATAPGCARLCRRSAAASEALPTASIGRVGSGALGSWRAPRQRHAHDPLQGTGRRLWWRTAAISSRQGFVFTTGHHHWAGAVSTLLDVRARTSC